MLPPLVCVLFFTTREQLDGMNFMAPDSMPKHLVALPGAEIGQSSGYPEFAAGTFKFGGVFMSLSY